VAASNAIAHPGPRGGHGDPPDAGPEHRAGAGRQPNQCIGRLQQLGLDDLGHDGLRGGKEEGGRRPANGCENGEVPRLGDAASRSAAVVP